MKRRFIGVLKSARSDFVSSGQWPSSVNINDCQTKARSARKDLAEALEKAHGAYVKAARDHAANAVMAEREQFLKESDVVPWGDNLVAGHDGEQRAIGAERRAFEPGDIVSGSYRLEIVAKRREGNGPLSLAIPVPGKKRIELKTAPGNEPELRVLLSVRESLISADLGVPRPIPTLFSADASPENLELWADQGTFEVTSIRLKPTLPAKADEVVERKEPPPKPSPRPLQPTERIDPTNQLTEKSKWRGEWRQDETPFFQRRDARVARRSEGEFDLVTAEWWGPQVQLTWEFQIGSGGQIMLTGMMSPGRSYADVQGGGTINGDKLSFSYAARRTGPKVANKPVSGSFELVLLPP